MIAGLTSEGVDALRVGVLPTPAVAYLTSAYDADFGVMISASHNPMPDNGIKIFGPGGHKLDDATEDRIEELVSRARQPARPARTSAGSSTPRTRWTVPAPRRQAVTTRPDGLTVVVDCAHGAASTAAPRAYRAAGADVIAINAEPNGLNINDGCGSTHLESLQPAVRRRTAPISASPTTATPTAASRSTPRARGRRRRDHGAARAGDARGRRAGVGHLRGDGDEQPRPAPGDARGGHRGPHHRGRRPLRARGDSRGRVRSAANSPATRVCRRSAPPATASSPVCG